MLLFAPDSSFIFLYTALNAASPPGEPVLPGATADVGVGRTGQVEGIEYSEMAEPAEEQEVFKQKKQ